MQWGLCISAASGSTVSSNKFQQLTNHTVLFFLKQGISYGQAYFLQKANAQTHIDKRREQHLLQSRSDSLAKSKS